MKLMMEIYESCKKSAGFGPPPREGPRASGAAVVSHRSSVVEFPPAGKADLIGPC